MSRSSHRSDFLPFEPVMWRAQEGKHFRSPPRPRPRKGTNPFRRAIAALRAMLNKP